MAPKIPNEPKRSHDQHSNEEDHEKILITESTPSLKVTNGSERDQTGTSPSPPRKSRSTAPVAEHAATTRPSSPVPTEDDFTSCTTGSDGDRQARVLEVGPRERLKRHRIEVAGQVSIPDTWGQEELLKDWIDCTAFDASLAKSSIMSARAALVSEGRIRAGSSSVSY